MFPEQKMASNCVLLPMAMWLGTASWKERTQSSQGCLSISRQSLPKCSFTERKIKCLEPWTWSERKNSRSQTSENRLPSVQYEVMVISAVLVCDFGDLWQGKVLLCKA